MLGSITKAIGLAKVIGKEKSKQLEKMAKAKQSSADAVEAKKTQQRDFMKYLANQPTSLGGTVGQLPIEMQKQIAESYSPEEREDFMNKIDEEMKNGK